MIETHTIRDLTRAIDNLLEANEETNNGFVADECWSAIQTIQRLIKCLLDE